MKNPLHKEDPFRDQARMIDKQIDDLIKDVRRRPMATRLGTQTKPTLWQKITHLFKGAST